MARLATFVHISDLHFGHIDPATRSSSDHRSWANLRLAEGLLGHAYIALQRLATFFENLRKTEAAQLIVTGDLTACGHSDQFESACEYLGVRLVPPKGTIGLGAPDYLCKGIPGNHDNWPGHHFPLGPATPALRNCFPNLPFTHSLPPLRTGQFIRFLGIDTDADLFSIGPGRFRARGAFLSQLAILDRMLPAPDKTDVRVLLLHHSRMFGAPAWTANLTMMDASRRALDDFLVRQNIKVILCGHTHVANVQVFNACQANRLSADVLECCCGTTTQRDFVPATWTTFWGKWPNWTFKPNTLLVHRLFDESGAIEWRTEQYVRKNLGFTLDVPYQSFKVA